jgi:hypothetical protein
MEGLALLTPARDSIFYRTIETMPEPITPTEYKGFQKAYDFFNAELFGGTLPHVLVTLQRHAKAKGYFSPDRFTGRIQAKQTAHELALNPDQFTGCTDEEILSTLAHEMAHVWQQTHGKPPMGSSLQGSCRLRVTCWLRLFTC